MGEAHKSAGNELYKASRYTEAADAYGSAIAACPSVSSYWCNRAAAYLMLRRFPEALADAKAAAGLEPGNAKAHARYVLRHRLSCRRVCLLYNSSRPARPPARAVLAKRCCR